MAIPDFQMVMLPLIEALADGQERTMRELTEQLASQYGLTDQERIELLPSGQQTLFSNRVAWAKTHLKSAGLLTNPTRGRVHISPLGRQVLTEKPSALSVRYLKRFAPYREFVGKAETKTEEVETSLTAIAMEQARTPQELIDVSFQSLASATAADLLSRLKASTPRAFEKIVVQLLLVMGYGGVAGYGTVTGKTGDVGIDGVIHQDKLGLDIVCIQAKRWEGPVGRPAIQQFVGSMDYHRSKKGVVLTTSTYTKEGLDFVHRIEGKKVVLIDGSRLADLMIEHDLGVTTTKTYSLKEVSNDFFDESEG